MTSNIDVIDNFLDRQDFLRIKQVMMSDRFPWYTDPNKGVAWNESKDGMYFIHNFLYQQSQSDFLVLLEPLLNKLPYDRSGLGSVKGNMYPSMRRKIYHDWHTDHRLSHKGCVFSINSNNGFTCFKNGKVKSVENRLMLFDPSVLHRSTTCTDQTCRVNININYYPVTSS